VYVTDIRTLDGAFAALRRMLADLRVPARGLARRRGGGRGPRCRARRPARAVVPIWRRPWMAVGRDTFTGAVLARLGVDNVLADDRSATRASTRAALPPHDLVVLPDEPYAFTADDGPGGVRRAVRPRLGRLLTWYGPSLARRRGSFPRSSPDSRMSDNSTREERRRCTHRSTPSAS
jgi:hypothetical protein